MNHDLPHSARKDFERAVALFNEGRLAIADGICVELLARFPADAEIAHFSGVLANRMGRYEVAVQRLRRSVLAQPRRAQAHVALGFAEDQLGHIAEARDAFSAAIRAEPALAEAHNGLGVTLLREGRLEEALPHFDRAWTLDPTLAQARLNSARALLGLGRVASAAQRFRETAALASTRPDILRICALGLQQLEELDSSADVFRALLALVPGDAVSRSQYALVLELQGQGARADEQMRVALAAQPAIASVHNAQGVIFLRRERWDDAASQLREALALDPSFADAAVNLAIALRELGRRDEALAAMRAAEARLDGVGLTRLAAMYGELGDSARCIEVAERAIQLSPFLPDAHYTLAIELLRTRRLERGWREHMFRPTRGTGVSDLVALAQYPPPLASVLAGREITIVSEQGLGDTLFFLRFARPLADAGVRLRFLGPDPRIAPIVKRSIEIEILPADHALAPGTPVVWCGDLPLLIRPLTGSDVCPALPLSPLPERVAKIRGSLGASGGKLVAVAWRAGTQPRSGRIGHRFLSKDIAPRVLGEALAGLDLRVVSIQREPAPGATEDVEGAVGGPVIDCEALNNDLEDMLALLSLVDRYVGVSSTNVHLHAGLGGRASILVPFPPDWRWNTEGESEWFPGYRTYRQSPQGDWSAATASLRADLAGGK